MVSSAPEPLRPYFPSYPSHSSPPRCWQRRAAPAQWRCADRTPGGPAQPSVGGDKSARAPEATAACPVNVSGEGDASQKVVVDLPYDLQTWCFTIPVPAELGDVGCGTARALASSQRLCEAVPGDRGCWFHVGNGAAGRVVAPQKPQPFPAPLFALGNLGSASGI